MFDNLKTPAVVIDTEKVKKNILAMSQIAQKNNCKLRPHIKTHKIPELAKMQIDAGACGITCSKLSEAIVMAEAGIKDIFMAYPVVDREKSEILTMFDPDIRLIVAVDSAEGAVMLSDSAQRNSGVIEVRMEVDTGLKRTGIPPDQALNLARIIKNLPGLRLTGIFTFRSMVYDEKATDDREAAGRQEGEMLAKIAQALRKDGITVEDVSAGSTPTAESVSKVDGITEIRPGTYIFNDMMQVNVGSATLENCAAAVLVTVISAPSESFAVVDGGSKTFSTDARPDEFPYFLKGLGKVIGHDDLIFERIWEEHGVLTSVSGKTNLKIGQRLMIIPNHICTTINLHDYVYFYSSGLAERQIAVKARGMLW